MKTAYYLRKMRMKLHENISGIKRPAVRWSFIGILAASMIGFFLVLAEVGFDTDFVLREWYNEKIEWIINFLMVMYSIQVLMVLLPGPPGITPLNIIVKIILLALLSLHFFDFIPFDISLESTSGYKLEWLFNYGLVIIIMFRSWSRIVNNIYSSNITSEKLFVVSFISLIAVGTILLLLPVSTTEQISFTDALFTSTSAVCVTGLTTLDTATDFTWFGKTVILFLFQMGGIGVMTFTSFFASVGRSKHSLSEGNALTSMVVAKNMRKLFTALYAVIIVTFIVESFGTVLIYLQLPPDQFPDNISRFTFALFHAVSSFCNAGFSLAPNGLMNDIFYHEWGIQMTMAWLIIFGGLGFFIITNYMERFALGMRNFIKHTILGHASKFEPNLININSRLVVRTTFWLLLLGTGLFLFFENDALLSGLRWDEKLYTAFFSTVTARTAGFNTLDYESIMLPSTLLIIILMWIGASPGSTGGGIKTTTFAIAFLTAFSLGRGKTTTHFHNRELSRQSGRKAQVIIFFSVFAILIATMFMAWFEPGVSMQRLLFEAFSAFGTVGLSMNLTMFLSEESKFILIMLMFIGRIGIITLFVAFIRKTRFLLFSYPEEELFI